MNLVEFATAAEASRKAAKRARQQEIPDNELTVVEYRSHPSLPYVVVTIYGPTAEAVQVQIDRAMKSVERDGGSATFKGPRRALRGFGAIGEVVTA